MRAQALGLWVWGASALGIACSSGSQSSSHLTDASSLSNQVDAAGQPSAPSDAATKVFTPVDAMVGSACGLPAAPADVCGALPTGKIASCSVDSSGQPSQTGSLEIDIPGDAPTFVCATSWTPDPSGGYIFGMPGTFMSQAQSCCGSAATPAASPSAPQTPIGDLGTLHIPSHIKPQEMEQPGKGLIRQDPFAVVVTDTTSGAAAMAAIATWHSWAGDGQAHTGSDGTGAYYFPSALLVNYVILETSGGFPVIVIGPEVSTAADGSNPIGHPSLGVCPAGGGAPLALIGGEVDGTTLTNHSGRFDYGPSASADALKNAAKLFNCFGVQITQTEFYPPKS